MARDRAFEKLLTDPGRVGIREARLACRPPTEEEMGQAIEVGRRRLGRRMRRGLRRGTSLAIRRHPAAAALRQAKKAGRLAAKATALIRRRIFRTLFRKLIHRRARLLAYQRRRSPKPNAAEQREAQAWTRAYVRRKGITGKLAAGALAAGLGAEPVATSALLTASIPVLIALARRILKTAEREGAPADPRSAAGPPDAAPAPAADGPDELPDTDE
jgi:hypothetical protein